MKAIDKSTIWQRVRVAFVGLAIVLLSIVGANVVIDQASDDPDLADINLKQDIVETGDIDSVEDTGPEPLTEFGVVPVPNEESDAPAPEAAEPGANPVVEDDIFEEDQGG